MGMPVKIADDLVLDARVVGKLGHRSIAGQIEFWARLGEAVESLMQGEQVMALLKAQAAKPLSACLESVDAPEGRRRVREYLEKQPFPHYQQATGRPGLLVRVDEDGTRTVGRFVNRLFTAVD